MKPKDEDKYDSILIPAGKPDPESEWEFFQNIQNKPGEEEFGIEDEPEPGFIVRIWEKIELFFARLRYKILKRKRKKGLLPIPGQPGLFYDTESKQVVSIRDF